MIIIKKYKMDIYRNENELISLYYIDTSQYDNRYDQIRDIINKFIKKNFHLGSYGSDYDIIFYEMASFDIINSILETSLRIAEMTEENFINLIPLLNNDNIKLNNDGVKLKDVNFYIKKIKQHIKIKEKLEEKIHQNPIFIYELDKDQNFDEIKKKKEFESILLNDNVKFFAKINKNFPVIPITESEENTKIYKKGTKIYYTSLSNNINNNFIDDDDDDNNNKKQTFSYVYYLPLHNNI
jgi:hypothetical protein